MVSATENTFGDRVKKLRKENNITQRELALELDLKSDSTIANYEQGRVPPHKTLEKLADYFGVTVDYLLGRSDARTTYEEIKEMVEDDPELLDAVNFLQEGGINERLFNIIKEADKNDREMIFRVIRNIVEREKGV